MKHTLAIVAALSLAAPAMAIDTFWGWDHLPPTVSQPPIVRPAPVQRPKQERLEQARDRHEKAKASRKKSKR